MTRKIRVAIMSDELDRPLERTLYFRRLIEGLLANSDVELTLVHSRPREEEPLYRQTREVILPRVLLPVGRRFASFIRYCLTTHDQYDVVHWLMPRLFPFFWWFPAKRTVITAHGGGDVLNPGLWTLSRIIFNWTLILFQKHIDALIGVSHYANHEIVYAYRIPPEKVFTIYNAVDPIYLTETSEQTLCETLAKYGLTNKKYFFYMGRFRVHKNVGRVVEAYLAYRKHNLSTHEKLALGGGTREEYEHVFGALQNSPYVSDVHFLGYIPTMDQPVLYRGALALVYISLNEGFGLPVIEAMACKTPVITSNVTSLPEVAGDAGIVVNPHDINAITGAMEHIAQDSAFREDLIRRGLEHSKLFTWEKTVAGVLELYRRLL